MDLPANKSETKKIPSCNKCQKQSDISFCDKCKKIGYCSRECQVADWKQHKLTCASSPSQQQSQSQAPVPPPAKNLLALEDQRVVIKVLRKHFINIYRYIFAIDAKEADSFKDRNSHFYKLKHESQTSACSHKKPHNHKPHAHNHSQALSNSENRSTNGRCCTSFFAKIYIPESQLSHLERSARETLAKHKLPYILPELLDFIGKKFFKLKQDGIKDGLKWDKQTQAYLSGECLKSGCQQFFINKIKEFSLKDQRIDSKQPLLLATSTTWRANNPKVPLNFLQKESIAELMTNGFTYIKNYMNSDELVRNLHKELNFLEMDGRFDESMQEGDSRSDRNLWISLGEISEKDFKHIRQVAFRLSSLPYELNDKAQIYTQISELFQISYFKGNGSFQKAHYDSSVDGNQDNGRKVTALYFCNLDNSIDCRNQGKLKLFTKIHNDPTQENEFVEFDTEADSLLIFKSRVFPYEFTPNRSDSSKRFVFRFWITGPVDAQKKF